LQENRAEPNVKKSRVMPWATPPGGVDSDFNERRGGFSQNFIAGRSFCATFCCQKVANSLYTYNTSQNYYIR